MGTMRHRVGNISYGLVVVVAVSAVTMQASAADLLRLSAAQRGAWESAAPELGRSAGIFTKHGITLDLLYTRDGEVESLVASGGSDVGVGVDGPAGWTPRSPPPSSPATRKSALDDLPKTLMTTGNE